MRKKYINLLIVVMVIFHAFTPSFLYVDARSNASSQPAACNWPSEMMQNYFNFQYEMIDALLWSDVSRYISANFKGWMFTNKVLTLHSVSAIDTLANGVMWSFWSAISNSVTSVVLLMLAAWSVIQSNIEWFSILFKDRPIVRDYKEMLDIETRLFDVAYIRSKQMDLSRPFESDLIKALNQIVKKYQWIWLLEPWVEIREGASMADILLDLIEMNSSMRHFISWWKNYWTRVLRDYNWCLWNQNINDDSIDSKCTREHSALKFTDAAIKQLEEDYKDVRSFWKCNSYANFFRDTIKKAINNNSEPVKTAVEDVKAAIKRLKNALIGKWAWDVKDPCKNISEYEMAQLQAYWWSDRKCGEWLSISSALLQTKEYFENKKAQREQKEKPENLLKQADKPESKNTIVKPVADRLKLKKTVVDREQEWFKIFGNDTRHNSDFLFELNSGFVEVYMKTIVEFAQDQEDGIAADISDILPRGKWILDQQDAAIRETKQLNGQLQQVADYQAAN